MQYKRFMVMNKETHKFCYTCATLAEVAEYVGEDEFYNVLDCFQAKLIEIR